jgi:hypothetical protein
MARHRYTSHQTSKRPKRDPQKQPGWRRFLRDVLVRIIIEVLKGLIGEALKGIL